MVIEGVLFWAIDGRAKRGRAVKRRNTNGRNRLARGRIVVIPYHWIIKYFVIVRI
jgi:hypothetical protein